MNQAKEKKKHIGALDVFILLAIAACAVCIGLRYYSVRNSDVNNSVQLENYILTFEIKNIKDSSSKNYMMQGTNFYLKESDEFLGTLREGITVNDARTTYVTPNGEIVIVANSASGDLYRVDVEGSMDVQGKLDSTGGFLLSGNRSLSVNKEIEVYSKYLAVKMRITGITKAQ